MLKFIPAIDLYNEQVVRLYKGNYNEVTQYKLDPADVIREFVNDGAQLIHIVDLNAARDGKIDINRNAILKIKDALDRRCDMELGGGIRSLETAKFYLDIGVDRVIIGTAAVKNPPFVKEAVAQFGADKIILGVDTLDGQIRVSGWEENSGIKTDDFLEQMQDLGVREIIYTDIARDGAMSGPAIEALEHVLSATNLRVIASGGISSMDDLKQLSVIKNERLVGVISGKAIYEKMISVRQAVQFCNKLH